MFSHLFIDRPIFATVLSIVIVIVGTVALTQLPIAQYPEVAPPTITVTANYPGANAKVVADTVATPIEQEVNGVENMIYMSSRCTNDGQMLLDVTFKLGTNLDMAQVLVQNRVKIAEAKLPEEVKRQGVTTKKKSPSILLCVNLISEKVTDPETKKERFKFDQLYLSNYATIYIKDELARVTGVGDVTFLGPRDYSMRVWLDPQKLAARNMTASDVIRGIKEQNVQVTEEGRKAEGWVRIAGTPPRRPRGRTSSLPSTPLAGWRARTSSATSSSRPTPMARPPTSATSLRTTGQARRAWNWAPRITTSTVTWTASQPSPWPSSSSRDPTRSRRQPTSANGWRS
jgi:Cu/Ag efflux pump CusA